jgi:hypothetical protein
MARLIRIRQDLIVSTDEIAFCGLAYVKLKDGRSFDIVPAVWTALADAATPDPSVDVTPFGVKVEADSAEAVVRNTIAQLATAPKREGQWPSNEAGTPK